MDQVDLTFATRQTSDLLEEFRKRDEVPNIRTRVMETGRRHGLGDKALQFTRLPLDEQKERLEHLQKFICDANAQRVRNGEDPNEFHDLEVEYDRVLAELRVEKRRERG